MLKLRILQVVPELNAGGVERGTIEVAKYLIAHNHQAFVCSHGGSMVEKLEKLGATHIQLPVHSKNPLRMLLNVFALKNLIRKHDIQIVHARSRAPAWSSWLAAKLLVGCSFVTTFHGTYNATNPLKRFYNSIMLKGDKVIAISNFIKKHIETRYHFVSEDIVVIHRGVDLDYFNKKAISDKRMKEMLHTLSVKLTGKVILLPARFARWKGHIFLLNALRYLEKHKFTCILVGDASERHYDYQREIEGLIAEYKLKNKVYICPAVTDMPALYSLADIVVSPSQEPEAFGRTITEAQAMENIVIATNIGAPLETIIDGKTGFLVEYNNPSHLSEVLDKVLTMKEQDIKKITSAASKHVKKSFSLESMCSATISVYKSVV